MPRGVVQDEYVASPLKRDVSIGVLQKDLEDLCVRMAELKRIEFTCSRTDDSSEVHSDMSAAVWLTDLVSLLRKTPSWTRISFDPALVEEPKVNALILQQLCDELDECLSLLFILTVGPGARYFQSNPLIVKPPHDGAVANFQLTALSQITVKLPSRPMSLVDFFRVEKNVFMLFAPLCINLWRTSRMRALDQPINPSLIEPSHPSGNRVSVHVKQLSDLFVRPPKLGPLSP